MNRTLTLVAIAATAAIGLSGCKKKTESPAKDEHAAAKAPAPTNRVDIPSAVRKNLGITFAKVETRNVARTLRVPGRFELLPTARREYRPAMSGRVQLLVTQFQAVEAGTPLYRLDSPRWRELQDQIATAESGHEQAAARLASIAPMRDAIRQRSESLTARVSLLTDRAGRLEGLVSSGAAGRKDLDEVKGQASEAQAELAEVGERSAELESRERELKAEIGSLKSRVALLLDTAASLSGSTAAELRRTDESGRPQWHTLASIEVRAEGPGVVATFGATSGAMVEQGSLVVSTVQPHQLRFRARGMQSDIGRLRAGLPARVVPPSGGSIPLQDTMDGTLILGLASDPDERTIDLLLTPTTPRDWARDGVAGYLEVTLEGGSSELALPLSAVVRDGVSPIIFRRDPANPDKAIRMDADVGTSDGRWIVIASGVKEGDEVVVGGNYQLMLATSGSAAKGGHFHSDGTFHEGEH